MPDESFIENIFHHPDHFNEKALALFHLQYRDNNVYRDWCTHLGIQEAEIHRAAQIPFLPISFFKTHIVKTGIFEPQAVFKSSGTTTTVQSRHFIKDLDLYKKSFTKGFAQFYGDIRDYCLFALLPSYQPGSSLVMMAQEWIRQTGHAWSGFYAGREELLFQRLQAVEQEKQKAILLGVSFALLDFAEKYSLPLNSTMLMETGGMKGRKKEITRQELHALLKQKFVTNQIHSEYGMTELLSQAYAKKDGLFNCPPWMKVRVRNENDPLQVQEKGNGILNIIDLANVYSCAFIATDDIGRIDAEGNFEVMGRLDASDLRGCSLMLA